MKPALAIDFDGTVTKDDVFPRIGKENMWIHGTAYDEQYEEVRVPDGWEVRSGFIYAPATAVIKELSTRFELIFHTCRTGKSQEMMIHWLSNNAFCHLHRGHDYYINHNPYCPEAHEKPFADVYLDNRGLTWHEGLNVEEEITKLMSKLPKHVYIPQTKR